MATCLGAVSLVLPAMTLGDNLTVSTVEPVLVTATLAEVAQRDAPAASTIIDSEAISQSSGQDLLELVSGTTGISLYGRGVGNRKVINLRGMESHHTLILVDGRRISASDAVVGHSDFQNGWVSKDSIERIEVVRGPLSSLYGSEGMGGVINIITKEPSKEWQGKIGFSAGQPSREGRELDMNLGLSGKLNSQLGVRLDVAVADHDKTELKSNPALSEAEGKESNSASLILDYKISEQHSLELYLNRIDEERPRDTLSRAGVAHESTYDIERTMVGVSYSGEFEQSQLSAQLYRSEIDVNNSTTNGVAATTPQTVSDTVFEAHYIQQLGQRQMLTVGTEIREESLEHAMMSGGSDSLDNRAVFLQDEISVSDALTLTFGARLDDHELFGSEWSPRAYLVYSLSDQWRIKAGYGEGFRAPTLKQISPNYRFEGFHTFVGNENLGPETSQTAELALQYYGEDLRAGVTVFRNDIEDLIQTQCIVNCSGRLGREFEYINVAEAQIDGIEVDAALPLAQGFSLSFNSSYLDTENKASGQALAYRPELSANAKLLWQSSAGNWGFSLQGQYVGEQVDSDMTLPEYQLWNFGVYAKLNEHLNIKAGVDNISDTYLADKDPSFSFEERGRFVYLGAELSF